MGGIRQSNMAATIHHLNVKPLYQMPTWISFKLCCYLVLTHELFLEKRTVIYKIWMLSISGDSFVNQVKGKNLNVIDHIIF